MRSSISPTARRWIAVTLVVGGASILGLAWGLRGTRRADGPIVDPSRTSLALPTASNAAAEAAPAQVRMAIPAAAETALADQGRQSPEPQVVLAPLRGKAAAPLQNTLGELRRKNEEALILRARQLAEPLAAPPK